REGCANVRNYIQSGNVVFGATAKVAKDLPARIEKAISKRFKYDVPILVRSANELAGVARGNPFLEAGVEAKTLHVAFLGDPPAAASVAALDPKRSPGDEFVVRGRE